MDAFLYPVLYIGPKATKTQALPGKLDAAVFQPGPLSESYDGLPYAEVTEQEGRYLTSRFPALYKFPDGMKLGVSREEFDALAAQVAALVEANKPKPTRGSKE